MADLLNRTQLLDMLEGNRRLTVRVLQAFPEQHLFSHAAPGMRSTSTCISWGWSRPHSTSVSHGVATMGCVPSSCWL
jgi:hypothetical protein